jgi:hypothetical protein
MLRELYPLFANDPNQKLPEIKFLHIDVNRVFGLDPHGARPAPESIHEWEPTEQQVSDIKRIYERDGQPVPRHPSEASRAWVIDEVSVSGGTSEISRKLLENAFPNLEVVRKTWMPAGKQRSGKRGYEAEIPTQLAPWYNKDFTEGRGVGEPDDNQFLSSRTDIDVLSQALRTDVHLLAKDIAEGKQAVRPITGCYELDPVTGEENLSRPKYKIARFVNGERTITDPYQQSEAGPAS